MSGRRGTHIFFFLLFFLVLVSSSYADRIIPVGPEEDIKKIQEALREAVSGDTVFVLSGEYNESIYLPPGITLKGENYYSVTIKGKIVCLNSDASIEEAAIENLTILYPYGESITYTNAHYSDFSLLADAGVIAIDSDIRVKYCRIMPDLELINQSRTQTLTHYGKAIQIWNLYNNPDITPDIENNLIKDTDCGVFYFSQAFSGAINGEIKNNTFYNNKIGVLLRMHKENPIIRNNIITKSEDAIYFTYNSLLHERLQNITYNSFGGDSFDTFGNVRDIWCEQNRYELQVMLRCAPSTPRSPGGCSYWNNNIDGDPLFVDADNGNFSLQIDSPCRGKADDGGDLGARMDFEPRLSISLSPTTWILDTVMAGSSKITRNDEKIIILNDGNVKENFSLQVRDTAGTWNAAETVDGIGLNQYTLSGIFTGLDILEVSDSNFNELGGEDLILEWVSQLSTDTKFAASISSKDGVGIMPAEKRALWLKFDAPRADTTEEQHNICVIINAELSK